MFPAAIKAHLTILDDGTTLGGNGVFLTVAFDGPAWAAEKQAAAVTVGCIAVSVVVVEQVMQCKSL